MGFGDLFIAALLGALLAGVRPPIRRLAVALAVVLGLAFNLLFLVVDELPATVPIALTLAVLELRTARAQRRGGIGYLRASRNADFTPIGGTRR